MSQYEVPPITEFGFLAQELKEVFPELVTVDAKGNHFVNYIGLIPLIVEALKEQKQEIEELKKECGRPVQRIEHEQTAAGLSVGETGNAALFQNNPNPFSQSTQIKYYLPQNTGTAYLCIYDLQGKQLKQLAIAEHGEGAKIISASEFSAGIYLYALIADGKEIDVKRMILTE
jgi:hypothetical protein